jgi:hypothetical protein
MAKTKRIPTNPKDHPLVALCKQHGNDAQNIRDAAHEIFHARAAGTENWDREVVHRKLKRVFPRPAFLWLHELKARAIEQLVSKHFGYDCGALEGWVHTSIMEAIKYGLPFADMEISLPHATSYLTDRGVLREAQAIIALVEQQASAHAE